MKYFITLLFFLSWAAHGYVAWKGIANNHYTIVLRPDISLRINEEAFPLIYTEGSVRTTYIKAEGAKIFVFYNRLSNDEKLEEIKEFYADKVKIPKNCTERDNSLLILEDDIQCFSFSF